MYLKNILEKKDFLIEKFIFLNFILLLFFLPISNSLVEIFSISIIVTFLIKLFLKRPSFLKIKTFFFENKINLILLIFYICIAFSFFSSGDLIYKSFRAWISKWGEAIVIFYCSFLFFKKKHFKTIVYVLLISGFIICIDGIFQKIVGIDFLRGIKLVTNNDFSAIRATFDHYNDFGTFLLIIFFSSIAMFNYINKKYIKNILIILIFLVIVNIGFTYSRGTWLAFFISCVILALFYPNKKIKIIICIILSFFIIGIFIIPTLNERFLFLLQKNADTGRFTKWEACISMFKDSPLNGLGLGLYMDVLDDYTSKGGRYAHNCYLQILAETGLLGIIPFLIFIITVITKSIKSLIKNMDNFLLCIFIAFISFLIHSFFDTQLYSLRLSILFWILCAFLLKIIEENKNKSIDIVS